jgi:hypothetical protein
LSASYRLAHRGPWSVVPTPTAAFSRRLRSAPVLGRLTRVAFPLARYSFVESIDVVAGLDSRSDPTKMTPTEFEHLVRQLFEARGLEGWTTDRVGDDGVDAVVVNRDPDVGAGSRLLRQAIHRDRREGSTVGEIEEIARRFAREEIAGGRRRAEGLSSVRFSEFQWRHGGR